MQTIGNTQLVEHGIFQDESDHRIHVGSQNAYWFSTKMMRELCLSNNFQVAYSRQGNIITAKGFLVPLECVTELSDSIIPKHLKYAYGWPPAKGTELGRRGEIAEAIVAAMIQDGIISFPRQIVIEKRKSRQLAGADLVHKEMEVVYQVKSDLGIEKYHNLYIQTHECNPFRQF